MRNIGVYLGIIFAYALIVGAFLALFGVLAGCATMDAVAEQYLPRIEFVQTPPFN